MSTDDLRDLIDEKITTNGEQEITGAILNNVLQEAVDTLADGENLDEGSIKTANIADGAITTDKIADGNVKTDKIEDHAVTKDKLEQNVSSDLDWAVASNSYYRNSQAGDVAAKVITTYKNMSLIGGGSLKVTFEQANTADDATLNIDGKGAKPLYYNGKRVSSTNSWEANETVEIYYNNYNSGIYYAKRWMVEPVSVSQNTETGKTELLIGNTPILIIDNKPELNSDNLVKSGGVYNNMPHIITNSEDADFGVSDSDGNVILESEDGHIKTKNFDSRNSPISTYDNSDSNLNIGDSNGNVICELKDGHIKTKNFDSRDSGGVVEYFNQDIKFVEPRSGAPSRLITSSTLTNKTTDEWLMIYCPGNGHTRDSVSFPDEALAYFRANKINVATLSYQTTLYGEPCVAWGSDAAYNAIIDLYNFLMANFGLRKDVILAGGSMGGLAMGQLAYKQPFPIRCCIGLGIVPGLDICWENSTTASPTNIKPKIRQTFGLAADGSEDYLYYKKSVGYDYRKYGWITVNETDYKTGYPNFYLYYGNDSVISGLFGGVENYNSMAQALINAGVYSEVKSAGNFIHDDPRIWLAYLEDNVLYKEIRTSIYNNN